MRPSALMASCRRPSSAIQVSVVLCLERSPLYDRNLYQGNDKIPNAYMGRMELACSCINLIIANADQQAARCPDIQFETW